MYDDGGFEREFNKRARQIKARVKAAIGERVMRVYYSAYECDEHGLQIDNLDVQAFSGKCIVAVRVGDAPQIHHLSKLENPTWLDLAVQSNEGIHLTRDWSHKYFEGFTRDDDFEGVPVLVLFYGS